MNITSEATYAPSDPMKELGNSGCKVELVFNKHMAVRKTSYSDDYAKRLGRQREKQENFLTPIPEIVIPKILGYDDVSFTMDHLPMLDAVEFFERASPAKMRSRIEVIINFLRWELENSPQIEIESQIFAQKIKQIQARVPQDIWATHYSDVANYFCSVLPSSVVLHVGVCHGDLTFSNIMFSLEESQVGLIDFLDGFLDSPLVDLAKLRQDTKFHWTNYRYARPHDHGKIHVIDTWIDDQLTANFSEIINSLPFWLIEVLNYLRIAPYVFTLQEHQYLKQALNEIKTAQEL